MHRNAGVQKAKRQQRPKNSIEKSLHTFLQYHLLLSLLNIHCLHTGSAV
jgi:hypothetical protein